MSTSCSGELKTVSRVYLWLENSPAYNVINVDLVDLLQQDINIYHTIGNVFIVGDWTSSVGNKRDFFECDRYVDFVDYAGYIPDTPSVRNTVDSVCYSPGDNMLDFCKATSIRVAYGRLDHDTGSVTLLVRRYQV